MTYFCNLGAIFSIYPTTTSTSYDTYQVYGTGYGRTPLESYQNAVVSASDSYVEDFKTYLIVKNYPNLQIEISIKSNIVLRKYDNVIPIPKAPLQNAAFNNSIKNTIIVRNLDDSTSEDTGTGTSTTSCIFEAMYYALDSCDINKYKNTSSIYVNTCMTSVK